MLYVCGVLDRFKTCIYYEIDFSVVIYLKPCTYKR